jgi:uncharacterized membrane protein
MQKLLIVLIFLTSLAFEGLAKDVEFSASAPAEVALGERFRLTYQVNTRPSQFTAPDFDGFRVLSGPNQSSSTSMQIINNRTTVTESFTYSYVLEATQEGSFRIGPASINADGDTHTSNPLNIKVVERKTNSTAPAQSSASQPNSASAKDLFIRATPSTSSPYQGQQVIITYTIYTRVPINQYSIDGLPSFRGFWSENITPDGQPETRTQVIDGTTYRLADIYKVAVFPQRSGELKIDPLDVEAIVSLPGQRRQSLLDEFFGGSPFDQRRTVRQNVVSNPLTLNVKPLPVQNKPAAFSGMVGTDFKVEASVNMNELNTNDAANLKLSISGRGNMRLLEQPKINFPANLEVFDPNVTDNIRNTLSGIIGSREYDYVMIPRTGGEFTIPSWSFIYFDPQTEKYITQQTPEFVLQVSGESSLSGTGNEGASQESIRTLGTDIRYIRTDNVALIPSGSMFYLSNIFWILLALPVLLFIFFIVYWRNHIKLQSNTQLLRNKKAEKLARKRLKTAKVFLDKKRENEFYDEIFKALWGYLSDKLSIPVSILNKENVEGAFKASKVAPELSDSFISMLNDCEFARFAPGEKEDRMAEIYHKALNTIVTIEKELRNKKS